MTQCPASMCPLFAREGSPWTGDKAAECPSHNEEREGGCAWWELDGENGCAGCRAASEQIWAAQRGEPVLQIGPVQAKRERSAPRSYDCPHAAECQWQKQAGDALCPPRVALALGLDPKLAAY